MYSWSDARTLCQAESPTNHPPQPQNEPLQGDCTTPSFLEIPLCMNQIVQRLLLSIVECFILCRGNYPNDEVQPVVVVQRTHLQVSLSTDMN